MNQTPSPTPHKLPPWLIILLVVGFLGIAWYNNRFERDTEKASDIPDVSVANSTSRRTSDDERSSSNVPNRVISQEMVQKSAPENETARQQVPDDRPIDPQIGSEPDASQSRLPQKNLGTAETPRKVESSGKSPNPPRAGPLADEPKKQKPSQPLETSKAKPKPAVNGSIAGKSSTTDETDLPSTTVRNQTIKDFGRVVFRGDIDLEPTLQRIARGERNSHRNDGTTFGNRERRLPSKPQGYYTEYIHPTKSISGPGPQRVILGKGGEVWYTPDHYESFKKIR